ncbi:MAG: DUF3341 domain-containing protein [Planctomycetota bacterium]|nr:MAG: DUF3341 domain-containing protein [Planctomycetota bacterium]RLS91913.1 MAG: DUF3341 domain-containing protein [Planctomycetota bacterium]
MSTATHAHSQAASSAPRPVYGLIAEFENPGDLMHAAEKVRDAGFTWWDCCTPFPVHGLDKAMGVKRTILPVLVFFAGASGTAAAFALQTFTNSFSFSTWAVVKVTGYPYLISGKPMMSLPAFIPVMFELTILFSALSCVGLMFLFNGLPRLFHPLLQNNRFRRATNDRFFVVIEARDPKFLRGKTEAFLRTLGATAVEAVED